MNESAEIFYQNTQSAYERPMAGCVCFMIRECIIPCPTAILPITSVLHAIQKENSSCERVKERHLAVD